MTATRAITRNVIYPLYELATGRRVLSKWRELEKTQWLDLSESPMR